MAQAPPNFPTDSAVPSWISQRARGWRFWRSAPVVDETGVAFLRTLLTLRKMRAEVQRFQGHLAEVAAAVAETDSQARSHKVSAAVTHTDEVLPAISERCQTWLAMVEQLSYDAPKVGNWNSDDVTTIRGTWEEAVARWQRHGDPIDDITAATVCVQQKVHDIIYLLGRLTLPERVNAQLRTLRVGGTLDITEVYRDELPDDADRTKLLKYLFASPRSVDGVVDVQHAVIYRASPHRIRRWWSYIMVLLCAAVVAALTYYLPDLNRRSTIPGFPDAQQVDQSTMLIGVLTAFAGALVHVMIGGLKQLKQLRRSDRPRPYAVGDWLQWMHVNETNIWFGTIAVGVAFIGSVFILNRVDFLTSFLVGYSADSLVDAVVQRFSRTVEAGTAALQQELTGPA